jgi:DNA-binding GntR family transcriptional regulator
MTTIRNLHANVARYLVLYLEGMDYHEGSQHEHRQLLEACRHGSVEQALEILDAHLKQASDRLVSFLKKNQSP